MDKKLKSDVHLRPWRQIVICEYGLLLIDWFLKLPAVA